MTHVQRCTVRYTVATLNIKSTNNEYQKKSFFEKKHAPLFKPFNVIATDSYIFESFGLYLAIINNAEILRNMLQTSTPILFTGSYQLYKPLPT